MINGVTVKEQNATSGEARNRFLHKTIVEPITKTGCNYDQTVKEYLRKDKEEDYTVMEASFGRMILLRSLSKIEIVESLSKTGDLSPSTVAELKAWIKAGGLKETSRSGLLPDKNETKYNFHFIQGNNPFQNNTKETQLNALKIFQYCNEIQGKNGFCTVCDVIAAARKIGLDLPPVPSNGTLSVSEQMSLSSRLDPFAGSFKWKQIGFTVDPKDKTKAVEFLDGGPFFIPDNILKSFEKFLSN